MTWYVRLHPQHIASLAVLRARVGVDVCESSDDDVWLRGTAHDEELEVTLRTIPGQEFEELGDGQLVPRGGRVPRATLPIGPWVPLKEWLRVELPIAALAVAPRSTVPLQLVRSERESDANVLLASMDDWHKFATSAAHIRLQPLKFAASDDGRVLVCGTPLPPIPGTQFVESDGVAVPCGWEPEPSLQTDVLRELLGLQNQDVAILSPNGDWQHVSGDDFVQATRSAVRASVGNECDRAIPNKTADE